MKLRHLLGALPAHLFLITLIGMVTMPFLPGPAGAEEKAGLFYDASKFDPLPIPKNIPAFTVIDQRSSSQIFINMKRNLIPEKYFANALKQSINQADSAIASSDSNMKFVIKEFVVELAMIPQTRNSARITSTIVVDVLFSSRGATSSIGSYRSSYYDDIENFQQGTDTSDVRYVINRSIYSILKNIFNDEKFISAISVTL